MINKKILEGVMVSGSISYKDPIKHKLFIQYINGKYYVRGSRYVKVIFDSEYKENQIDEIIKRHNRYIRLSKFEQL